MQAGNRRGNGTPAPTEDPADAQHRYVHARPCHLPWDPRARADPSSPEHRHGGRSTSLGPLLDGDAGAGVHECILARPPRWEEGRVLARRPTVNRRRTRLLSGVCPARHHRPTRLRHRLRVQVRHGAGSRRRPVRRLLPRMCSLPRRRAARRGREAQRADPHGVRRRAGRRREARRRDRRRGVRPGSGRLIRRGQPHRQDRPRAHPAGDHLSRHGGSRDPYHRRQHGRCTWSVRHRQRRRIRRLPGWLSAGWHSRSFPRRHPDRLPSQRRPWNVTRWRSRFQATCRSRSSSISRIAEVTAMTPQVEALLRSTLVDLDNDECDLDWILSNRVREACPDAPYDVLKKITLQVVAELVGRGLAKPHLLGKLQERRPRRAGARADSSWVGPVWRAPEHGRRGLLLDHGSRSSGGRVHLPAVGGADPDVERRGFEPLTSAVRGQRSPS